MPSTPATPSSRLTASCHQGIGFLLLATAATLLAQTAHAQATEPASAASAPAAAAAPPKYAARDIERAFAHMDASKDGKVSREEAAGFRGVAKHFDEADTNKDGVLSRDEFERALNHGKKAEVRTSPSGLQSGVR